MTRALYLKNIVPSLCTVRSLVMGGPGAILREMVFPALPQGKAEIARMQGVPRQSLYGVHDASRAITPKWRCA